MIRRSRVLQTALAVGLLLLVACATTGPGGEKSLILIPTSYEVSIGQGMAQQVRAQETVHSDTVWQAYLDEVGQRIVKVSDRNDIEYHFTVIESDQVNAFAAPGGYIYFYTGLLKKMDSEAEMAAVMAHEISHVVARHGIKRLQAAMGVQLAYQLVFGDGDQSEALNAAIGIGMGLAFAGYSRENEREADRYGIIYMRDAGYDPRGAVDMFETLKELRGDHQASSLELLASSHPEADERIQNARQQIAQMQLSGNLTVGRDRYQQMLQRLGD